MIVIDTREQRPLDFGDVLTVRGTLQTGDYSLEGLETICAVERKSLDDLVACVTSQRERFEAELARLAAMPFACVVVEADFRAVLRGSYTSRARVTSVLGSIVAWSIDFVPFYFAGDRAAAAHLIVRWLEKAAKRADMQSQTGTEATP